MPFFDDDDHNLRSPPINRPSTTRGHVGQPTMIFRLDEDCLLAVLKFADPFSLTSFEITSKHAQQLVESTWVVQARDLKEREEGGSTPRQRVLSSFAVNKCDILCRLTQMVEGSTSSELSEKGIAMLPWEKLDTSKHLVYLRMSGQACCRYSTPQTFCESVIQIDSSELHSLYRKKEGGVAKIPLSKCQFQMARASERNDMQDLLDHLYPEAESENMSFRGTMNSCHRIDFINRRLKAITMVAFDRKTLAPSILFKDNSLPEGPASTLFACTQHEDGHVAIVASVGRSMNTQIKDSDGDTFLVRRSVHLYFQKNSFGLAIGQRNVQIAFPLLPVDPVTNS